MATRVKKDRNNPEWTVADFARARPARDVLPRLIGKKKAAELLSRTRGQRGPGLKPAKVPVSIRLDQDIVSYFKSNGIGWQSRINSVLRKALRKAA